jgi:hypothetical protein
MKSSPINSIVQIAGHCLAFGVLMPLACAQPGSASQTTPVEVYLPIPGMGSGGLQKWMGLVDPEHFEEPSTGPRTPLQVPLGTTNLGPQCHLTTSALPVGNRELQKLVDNPRGKAKRDFDDFVTLPAGVQWVQLDLAEKTSLYAIVIWRNFQFPMRFYRGVVVQIADDAEFRKNVRTLFNNDYRNLTGLGAGEGREYLESYEGKLIEAHGAIASSVRIYSAGSTESAINEYFAVDVFGLRPLTIE